MRLIGIAIVCIRAIASASSSLDPSIGHADEQIAPISPRSQVIPEEYSFNAEDGAWVSSKSGVAIKQGSVVRAKLITSETKQSRKDSGAIATLLGAFLGPVADSVEDDAGIKTKGAASSSSSSGASESM